MNNENRETEKYPVKYDFVESGSGPEDEYLKQFNGSSKEKFYKGVEYLEKGEFEMADNEFQRWESSTGKSTPNFYKRQIIEGFLDQAKNNKDNVFADDALYGAENFLRYNDIENKELYSMQTKDLKRKIAERGLKKTELSLKKGDLKDASNQLENTSYTIGLLNTDEEGFSEKYKPKIQNLEKELINKGATIGLSPQENT